MTDYDDTEKRVGLSISTGVGCLCLIVMFSIWIGVFFGVTYPEIRVKETFLPSNCTIIDRDVNSFKCCFPSCGYCEECYDKYPSCSSSLVAINSSMVCCNGYSCCGSCCDTCESCDNDGKCTSYSCNCRCCSEARNELCTLYCNECWSPNITVQYQTVNGQSVISNMNKECNSNFDCVNQYFEKWKVGQLFTCYYNPSNIKEFATTNEYTPYKFGVMYTFAGLTIVSIIGLAICLCCLVKGICGR